MISNINLNVVRSSPDIVNIFMVDKLKSSTGNQWIRNGLFGHDNERYDKHVAFFPNRVIHGTTNN